MIQKKYAIRRTLLLLGALGLAYVLIFGPKVFAVKKDVAISPNGEYRIEYLKPGFPYFFSLTKEIPMLIRLYDNRSGKLLGESDIVDMNGGNGEIFWGSKYSPYIRVGMDFQFPLMPEAKK